MALLKEGSIAAPAICRGFPSLYRPALAVVAAEEVVGGECVGDAHVGGVVGNFLSDPEGDYAKEHDLG